MYLLKCLQATNQDQTNVRVKAIYYLKSILYLVCLKKILFCDAIITEKLLFILGYRRVLTSAQLNLM